MIVAAASILALSTAEGVTSTGHITTFIPRSQGANTARELVGWQRDLFRCYTQNYAAIAGTIEYTRSFELCGLTRKLFSTSALTFAGSQNPNQVDGVDIVADYFGLPTNFHGTLIIKPRIENVIIDLNFFFGHDICNGLFLRVHAPITHTKWSLGLVTPLLVETSLEVTPHSLPAIWDQRNQIRQLIPLYALSMQLLIQFI